MAKKKTTVKPVRKVKGVSREIAIIALVLNILLLPGVGSIVGRKTKEGIWQLVLFIIGLPLSFILVGIPLVIASWIWGLITGIKLIEESHD